MKVVIRLNREKLEENHYCEKEIFKTLQRAAYNENVNFEEEQDVFIFKDRSGRRDYMVIWRMLLHIASCRWFLKTVESCMLYDEEQEIDILFKIMQLQSAANYNVF